MIVLLAIVAGLAIVFVSYAAFLRHRDAVARRAWHARRNEQALANDAARAARRMHPTSEGSSDPVH